MNDVLAQLAQLAGPILKSPQGQQMAQAIMAKMGGGGGGGDPRAAMATGMPNRDGGGPSVAGPVPMAGRNPDEGIPVPMGGRSGPDTDMENQDTEGELEMARQMMGSPQTPGDPTVQSPGGQDQGGGMNQDGPTPEEAQMLKSNPSPRNKLNFDKLFGKGAADMVLQADGGGGTYEDDVRGAMQDKGAPPAQNNDDGDHEYR